MDMLDLHGSLPAIRLMKKNDNATSKNNAVLKYRLPQGTATTAESYSCLESLLTDTR